MVMLPVSDAPVDVTVGAAMVSQSPQEPDSSGFGIDVPDSVSP